MKIIMILTLISALESDQLLNLNFHLMFLNESISTIGIGLMILSMVWIMLAQYQMGKSWRIGIDEKNKTELKTIGLFRVSRNPIFLGMILSQLGFVLYNSTVLNLFILIVTYILISIQVRLEEEFLEKQHGSGYQSFKQKVPRWILFK